jgi:hypothetical protein
MIYYVFCIEYIVIVEIVVYLLNPPNLFPNSATLYHNHIFLILQVSSHIYFSRVFLKIY